MNKNIMIELTEDEALILFDCITRFNEKRSSIVFRDESEKKVIFDIESDLETKLASILDQDYELILNKAKKNIK